MKLFFCFPEKKIGGVSILFLRVSHALSKKFSRDTYLIDYNYVESLLQENDHGTFKGLILVDFAGRAVNLEKFKKLANKYGLWILEDSCHAPGGFFLDSNNKKQNCGNRYFCHVVWSMSKCRHIHSIYTR